MWILSADIGGTKLALAISNEQQPEILLKQLEVESPQQADTLFEALINGFTSLLDGREGNVKKVAVGLPGILDLELGVVVYQQNLPWRDYPLVEKLQAIYTEAKIFMETDMMTAANGEYKIRHLQHETFLYITVSTGIACCSIQQGQFIRGDGIPGEIGFSLTTSEDYLEEQCAGPGLTKWLGRETGRNEKLSTFLELYYAKDEAVTAVIKQWQKELALKIHSFILLFDPHVVVLGGGVMNHHPQLVREIGEVVDSYFSLPFFKHKKGRVEASINKGNAGLIGAALL